MDQDTLTCIYSHTPVWMTSCMFRIFRQGCAVHFLKPSPYFRPKPKSWYPISDPMYDVNQNALLLLKGCKLHSCSSLFHLYLFIRFLFINLFFSWHNQVWEGPLLFRIEWVCVQFSSWLWSLAIENGTAYPDPQFPSGYPIAKASSSPNRREADS